MKTNAAALRKLSQYGHIKRYPKVPKGKRLRVQTWATYAEYLLTEHWQYMRQRMLARARYACNFCGCNRQLHVHHRTYERIGRERPEDLVVLCAECHSSVHDLRHRQPWMSLREATNAVKRQTNRTKFVVIIND